jgi:hypothetical protein
MITSGFIGFSNGKIYEIGSATTEVEAKQKATKNIKLINIRHEYKKTVVE